MIDHVEHTLALWRRTPFVPGDSDCMLSIGDYIARRGGMDCTWLFRGTYDTDEAGLAIMKVQGGLGALIDLTGIARIGGEPLRGDVVGIAVPAEDGGEIGGICTGDMVAARLARGVVEIKARFVRLSGVWRCPR